VVQTNENNFELSLDCIADVVTIPFVLNKKNIPGTY